MRAAIREALIVAILAAVGAAVGLIVGAFHQDALGLGMWILFHPVDSIPWAILGVMIGGGLGCVWRLSIK